MGYDLNSRRYPEDRFDLESYKKSVIHARFETFQRRNRRITNALTLLALFFAMLSTLFLADTAQYYYVARLNEQVYQQAREAAHRPPPAVPAASPAPAETETPETPEPLPEKERELLPEIESLRQFFGNDDIVGYVQIDGTNIDYPVAHTTDNEFYLNHDLYGQESAAGTVFMDYENDPEELDRNTVLYGHNMRNGTMFHNLRYFADINYLNAHPVISLMTPYEQTYWQIFAFYKTKTDFYYIQTEFATAESFTALVNAMKERSVHETDVDVGPDDYILTLSTCTNEPDDSRYVVNARLLETSER